LQINVEAEEQQMVILTLDVTEFLNSIYDKAVENQLVNDTIIERKEEIETEEAEHESI